MVISGARTRGPGKESEQREQGGEGGKKENVVNEQPSEGGGGGAEGRTEGENRRFNADGLLASRATLPSTVTIATDSSAPVSLRTLMPSEFFSLCSRPQQQVRSPLRRPEVVGSVIDFKLVSGSGLRFCQRFSV